MLKQKIISSESYCNLTCKVGEHYYREHLYNLYCHLNNVLFHNQDIIPQLKHELCIEFVPITEKDQYAKTLFISISCNYLIFVYILFNKRATPPYGTQYLGWF